MQRKILIAFILLLPLVFSCQVKSSDPAYVATSQPLSFILSEIVGASGEVHTIVPSGASPHTYAPKPTDMYKINASKALFFAALKLDGWAKDLAPEKSIEMIELLPQEYILEFDDSTDNYKEMDLPDGIEIEEHTEHEHGHDHSHEHSHAGIDPHFWTDPMAVKALIPPLVDKLIELDPDNAEKYQNNAELFIKRLDLLNRQANKIIAPVKGRPVFLFHPSMRYFLKRYQLEYAGAIELSPGQEATAEHMKEIIEKIKASGTSAIFSEPQLSDKPAKVIAEAANVYVYTLDPIGAEKSILNYSDLILYNAKVFKKALK